MKISKITRQSNKEKSDHMIMMIIFNFLNMLIPVAQLFSCCWPRYRVSFNLGWSNFCTLVGHFSKLFEFAGLNRLKTPIFVPKSGCSLKKKKKRSSLGIGLRNSYFRPKIIVPLLVISRLLQNCSVGP